MTAHTFRWKPLVAIGLVSGFIQVTIGVAMYLMGIYFAPANMLYCGCRRIGQVLGIRLSGAVSTGYNGGRFRSLSRQRATCRRSHSP